MADIEIINSFINLLKKENFQVEKIDEGSFPPSIIRLRKSVSRIDRLSREMDKRQSPIKSSIFPFPCIRIYRLRSELQ